jgi:hypothetical protein
MDDHEDRIWRRAYHLWEEAGRPEGGATSFGMRPVPKSQMRKRRKRLVLFPEVMPA